MNFRWFVNNPIKVTMFFIGLLLMGYLSYRRLPLNMFPELQTPRITIVAMTKGLPPDQAERLLTADFERQLSSIKGVAGVVSYTRERSIVTHVDFHWGQDMEFAYLDVKKNIGALEANENIDEVEVFRFDPNAEPLMTLAFTGEIDRIQVTSFVENSLKPKLETVEGVAYVRANGASRDEVRIRMSEDALARYKLTPGQVLEAIQASNIASPGGTVVEGNEEMELKMVSRFRGVEDIARCVVTMAENHPIHLTDIADITVAPTRDEVIVRQDGRRTITLDIFREPDANAVFTARRVREMVQNLNTRGAYGLKTALDQSLEVEASIQEVLHAALIGMGLAVLVLLVFLRNLPATLIVALAIPISIVCTFSLMYFQNLSLNIMTLGGLALGVGMLVDNGIVVIENIFRHRQSGASRADAATVGTGEVAMAITASTLTTIVIFVPLVYVHGIAGILFRDQALTVVYSLLMSLVVALSLIPMLGARTGSSRSKAPGAFNLWYGRFLGATLRLRWALLLLFCITMWASWHLARRIPSEFFPPSVNGRLSMLLEMPPGTPLEQTEDAVRRIEQSLMRFRDRDANLAPLLRSFEAWNISGDEAAFVRDLKKILPGLEAKYGGSPWFPKVRELVVAGNEPQKERAKRLVDIEKALNRLIVLESVTSVIGIDAASAQSSDDTIYGPHTARMEISLNPQLLKELDAADLIAYLRKQADRIPGLHCNFESRNEFLQMLLGKNRGDIVVEVHAAGLSELREAAANAENTLKGLNGLTNLRTNLVLGEEALVLEPNPDAMLRGKHKLENITNQAEAYLRGTTSERLKLEQGEMAVTISSAQADSAGLQGLLNLPIISEDGTKEKLRDLVHLRRERGISEIMRVNQEKTALVMADLAGIPYQTAVGSVQSALDTTAWPKDATWNFSGEEIKRRESFQKLFFALLIAILLVYMVIAAILESLIHPLTIMLAVPFALTGVVVAFLASGISLNIMGYIGIVMLVGIVVNNAIVLLDRVRQLREAGASVRDALIEAGRQRLRPILMTTLTTMLALIPLALGIGNGAELRRPMAVAVIGGLGSSTLLTLLILPALYLCIEDGLTILRHLLLGSRRSLMKTGEESVS